MSDININAGNDQRGEKPFEMEIHGKHLISENKLHNEYCDWKRGNLIIESVLNVDQFNQPVPKKTLPCSGINICSPAILALLPGGPSIPLAGAVC